MALISSTEKEVKKALIGLEPRWKVVYTVLAIWLLVTAYWNPRLFASQLVGGFVYGMILVMISLGLSLIFGLMGVVNFAHGALFMLGAYFSYALVTQFSIPFPIVLILAPVFVGLVGVAMELTTLRPLYGKDPLSALLVTYGIAMMMEEGVRFVWGSTPKSYESLAALAQPVSLGIVSISGFRIFTMIVSTLVICLTYLLVTHTDFGLTIQAGIQNAEMTEAVGVNLPIRFSFVFFLGALLAGLAGVLRSAEVGFSSGMGGSFIILTFVVIVIGGMGSLFGGVVGGLFIGMVQFLAPGMLSAAAHYTGMSVLELSGIESVLPFVLMIIVLLNRPQGLFGQEGFLE